MQKAQILIAFMILATLKVSAYEYHISADNKYHSEPLMVVNNNIQEPSEVARISSSILRPIGHVFGGLLIGLAGGLIEGVDSGS